MITRAGTKNDVGSVVLTLAQLDLRYAPIGGAVQVATHAAASKTPPVDADEFPLVDSTAAFGLKRLTWANVKAALTILFDARYPAGSGTSTGTNTGDQALPVVLDQHGFATGIRVPDFVPAAAATVGTASRAYAIRFRCPVSITITKIAFGTTVAATTNDNCDVGIFSSDGTTLLRSSGSTAGKLNAAAGVQTVTLTSGIALTAGTIYYVAFAYGTVGGTAATIAMTNYAGQIVSLMGSAMPNLEQGIQAAAFPLAAPLTLTAVGGTLCPVLGLLT